MDIFKTIAILLVVTGLYGCDGGGDAAAFSDDELREKVETCQTAVNPSRTKVLACENYQRECQRRAENGFYVC